MRLPIAAVLIAVLALPASAGASTVALEGTELVYRADPGQADRLTVGMDGGTAIFRSGTAPITGCGTTDQLARCDTAGVTAIRLLTAEGDDRVDLWDATVPMIADLGPGDDEANVVAGTAKLTLIGGDGDDEFGLGPASGPADIVCGPGADSWSAGPRHRPGDGCAPSLAGITPKSVSRAFREGSLTGPASGSVTFRRRADGGEPGTQLARGTFTARAGALRVSVKPTSAGRRALRRDPRPRVIVFVRTLAEGGDRGATVFASRIAR